MPPVLKLLLACILLVPLFLVVEEMQPKSLQPVFARAWLALMVVALSAALVLVYS